MTTRSSLWPYLAATGLAAVGLLGSGCASPPAGARAGAGGSPASSAAPETPPTVELRTGMTPDEVRRALGNPRSIEPISGADQPSEIWIYERGRKDVVKQVVAGTEEIPYVDPITGQMRTIPEPVYAQETTTIIEELRLVWLNGALASWKIERRLDRSYVR